MPAVGQAAREHTLYEVRESLRNPIFRRLARARCYGRKAVDLQRLEPSQWKFFRNGPAYGGQQAPLYTSDVEHCVTVPSFHSVVVSCGLEHRRWACMAICWPLCARRIGWYEGCCCAYTFPMQLKSLKLITGASSSIDQTPISSVFGYTQKPKTCFRYARPSLSLEKKGTKKKCQALPNILHTLNP